MIVKCGEFGPRDSLVRGSSFGCAGPRACGKVCYEHDLASGGKQVLRARTLAIHDLSGRMVRLMVGETQSAERHSVIWDGRDRSGRAVSSGPYFYRLFYRLDSDGRTLIRRKMLLK